MRTLLSVFVLTALSSSAVAAPCNDDDLSCIKRALLDKVEENKDLLGQIERYRQLDSNSQRQIKNLQDSNEALNGALKPALDAVAAARPKFYQTAEFGVAIGLPLGVILTVVAVIAGRQLVIVK